MYEIRKEVQLVKTDIEQGYFVCDGCGQCVKNSSDIFRHPDPGEGWIVIHKGYTNPRDFCPECAAKIEALFPRAVE